MSAMVSPSLHERKPFTSAIQALGAHHSHFLAQRLGEDALALPNGAEPNCARR